MQLINAFSAVSETFCLQSNGCNKCLAHATYSSQPFSNTEPQRGNSQCILLPRDLFNLYFPQQQLRLSACTHHFCCHTQSPSVFCSSVQHHSACLAAIEQSGTMFMHNRSTGAHVQQQSARQQVCHWDSTLLWCPSRVSVSYQTRTAIGFRRSEILDCHHCHITAHDRGARAA